MNWTTAGGKVRISAKVELLIAARIVRAPVLAIGNTIAITVAIHSIRDTITVTISMIRATLSVRNLVSNATGKKTADGDQQYSKLFHIVSWTK
jgi:hypothetical protein